MIAIVMIAIVMIAIVIIAITMIAIVNLTDGACPDESSVVLIGREISQLLAIPIIATINSYY